MARGPLRSTFGASLLLLGACSSGGSLDIGGSQAPDPATVDFPVAYIKRSLPTNGDDLRQLRDAVGDADLWMRERASPAAIERNITQRITADGEYDLRDLDISPDGTRLLFALRGPLRAGADERDAPLWALWEYNIAADSLRRVVLSDTVAAEGQDRGGRYLPDGRILFLSTRQRQAQAVLRDEGKAGFEAQTEDRDESAFVLHVMNADGSGIQQLSFNPSHDSDPSVLADGRLMWSRWDHAPGRSGLHLYTANPDGTQLQLLYGADSHQTGTQDSRVEFVRARELQDGRVAALLRPMSTPHFGGALAFIDVRNFVENFQPVGTASGSSGPAQRPATPLDINTLPGPSAGGRFHSVFPLWDGSGRLLATWSPCRLRESGRIVACTAERLATSGAEEGPLLYSPWLLDPANNTFRPLFEPVEGEMVTEIVAAQPRPLPAVRPDGSSQGHDRQLEAEGYGILDIRSVYDFDGVDRAIGGIAAAADPARTLAWQRWARFIRIEKPVSLPDRRVLAFDAAAFGTVPYMREILGYAPIEPDGSVRIKVPANVAFQLSITDADGRRLDAASSPLHRAWLQLRPGEERRCNGCHTPAAGRSHGRDGLGASVWAGASSDGLPFPATQARLAALAGETMAQARVRWSCANDGCRALKLSPDVVYTDEWTDPATAGRAPDAAFSLRYAGSAGLGTPAPASPGCLASWTVACRSVIHYVQHIHPLWTLPRVTLAADGVTVLADNTCTRCHSPTDAAGALRVPAGQLDLGDGDAVEQPLHKKAYRELFFTDTEQALLGGVLQDAFDVSIDPRTGDEIRTPRSVAPSLSAGSALASRRFFARFDAGGSHMGWLTPAERRLLAEWVDIGGQYYNDPFHPAVPRD
ncbi:MAG: hypothetical protein RL026_693 [Pseudomonadota bacterium]